MASTNRGPRTPNALADSDDDGDGDYDTPDALVKPDSDHDGDGDYDIPDALVASASASDAWTVEGPGGEDIASPIFGVNKNPSDAISLADSLAAARAATGLSAAGEEALIWASNKVVDKLAATAGPAGLDGLTRDEAGAINIYTQESPVYKILNKMLMASDRDPLKQWFSFLNLFLTALHKLPSCPGTYYRGVTANVAAEYPKGKHIVWWAFSSSTASIEALGDFMKAGEPRVLFSLDVQRVVNINKFSSFPKEDERLLLAGIPLQVKSTITMGPNLTMVQMTEDLSCPPLIPGFMLTPPPPWEVKDPKEIQFVMEEDEDESGAMVKRELGSGSFGRVYAGTFRGHNVAIKQIAVAGGDMIKAFRKEASITFRMQHKNVARCFGGSISKKFARLVTEQLMASLHDDLHVTKVEMSTDDVRNNILQVAQGLAYLHQHNVTHRDLKPANVMRNTKGVFKMIDFGLSSSRLSSMASQGSVSGANKGTTGYMAPELYTAAGNYTVDTFAFGMLGYETVMRSQPFSGTSAQAIGRMVEAGKRPELPATHPNLSPGIAEVIRACWHQQPERRPDMLVVVANLMAAVGTSGAEVQLVANDAQGAQDAIAAESNRSTTLKRYRKRLTMYLNDGILDADEQEALQEEFGNDAITQEEHAAMEAEIRAGLTKGQATHTFQGMAADATQQGIAALKNPFCEPVVIDAQTNPFAPEQLQHAAGGKAAAAAVGAMDAFTNPFASTHNTESSNGSISDYQILTERPAGIESQRLCKRNTAISAVGAMDAFTNPFASTHNTESSNGSISDYQILTERPAVIESQRPCKRNTTLPVAVTNTADACSHQLVGSAELFEAEQEYLSAKVGQEARAKKESAFELDDRTTLMVASAKKLHKRYSELVHSIEVKTNEGAAGGGPIKDKHELVKLLDDYETHVKAGVEKGKKSVAVCEAEVNGIQGGNAMFKREISAVESKYRDGGMEACEIDFILQKYMSTNLQNETRLTDALELLTNAHEAMATYDMDPLEKKIKTLMVTLLSPETDSPAARDAAIRAAIKESDAKKHKTMRYKKLIHQMANSEIGDPTFDKANIVKYIEMVIGKKEVLLKKILGGIGKHSIHGLLFMASDRIEKPWELHHVYFDLNDRKVTVLTHNTKKQKKVKEVSMRTIRAASFFPKTEKRMQADGKPCDYAFCVMLAPPGKPAETWNFSAMREDEMRIWKYIFDAALPLDHE